MSKPPELRLVDGSAVDGSGQGARAPLRILIADDERDTATVLAAILRDEGHEAHVVLRGDEVLEMDRLVRPDVVILDINMPGMSGFAVAREIRSRRGVAAPLLIAISGKWTRKEDQELGEGVGFEHYLLKPCEPSELIAVLNDFRQQHQTGKTTAK
jgi:two-component system OmpR family response regulator